MKSILKIVVCLLLLNYAAYGQKSQIKDAQKEFKAGHFEETLAILKPIEYLINNASDEDKIHFYYLKGNSLLNLAQNKVNVSNNLSLAAATFSDLIQVENESGIFKYTPEISKAVLKIKIDLLDSAKEDMSLQKFANSSDKFYQAYTLDKKDTLQLYNAAVSYNKANEVDLALKCFEELKMLDYSGGNMVYIAYSKKNLADEMFATLDERDLRIQYGTHIKPRQELRSKKAEIYKNIALIYAQKGYKEKAIKIINQARKYNGEDGSLALMEANLYLETKDYDYFDKLASDLMLANPNDAELVNSLGISCQNQKYFEGAEFYYKKAMQMDSRYTNPIINLSVLIIDKGVALTARMNNLGASSTDKKNYEELKLQRENLMKSVVPYLQRVISIDPFNASAKQLLSSINNVISIQSKAIASDE
ncbi:tetratricopeptide repeat protein [Flavobacterium sp. N3904]|uniref:tetratricopeptide repeat protein n=1 Tax=Flavobacterium sp. N3904 TaxID=2986835 RepID=UPI002225862C|nr:hypothetical protein [Flavobacterium sp. N3904]